MIERLPTNDVPVTLIARFPFTTNPLDELRSATVRVYRPAFRLLMPFPRETGVGRPAADTSPVSAPRETATPEPTMSCEVAPCRDEPAPLPDEVGDAEAPAVEPTRSVDVRNV